MRAAVSVGMIVAVGISANAAEAAKDGKEKTKGPDATRNPVFTIPTEITLTPEQQTKLDEIKAEQAPRIVALNKKLDAVLTDDQKAARKDATAKAKADGKKGKEAAAAIDEALKLTDDQMKVKKEVQLEMATLQRSIKEEINAFLTDEQRTHYKLPKAKKAS